MCEVEWKCGRGGDGNDELDQVNGRRRGVTLFTLSSQDKKKLMGRKMDREGLFDEMEIMHERTHRMEMERTWRMGGGRKAKTKRKASSHFGDWESQN